MDGGGDSMGHGFNAEIATCIPEEMRYFDVNTCFEEAGFRNMNNFSSVADLVAHICAAGSVVLAVVVDCSDRVLAEQAVFIRLITKHLIVVHLVDGVPAARQPPTPHDFYLDANNLEGSMGPLAVALTKRGQLLNVYTKWVTEHVTSEHPLLAAAASERDGSATSDPNTWNSHGSFIGRGALGDVFQSSCELIGKPMAGKMVDTTKLAPGVLQALDHEIALMARLPNSPYIIRFFYASSSPNSRRIYLELCKTSVQNMTRTLGAFPLDMARMCLSHLLSALVCLHGEGIVHRDIKPDNVLVAYDGVYKLADLGSAIELQGPERKVPAGTMAGTLLFMAPEVFNGKAYDCSADIWSVGIFCLAVLKCLPTDESQDVLPAFFNPDRPDDQEPAKLPLSLSKHAHAFVSSCLQRDPTKRMTAEQLLTSEFVAALSATASSRTTVAQYASQSVRASVCPVFTGGGGHLNNSASASDVLGFVYKK